MDTTREEPTSGPLTALRKHWIIALALALIGGLVGGGIAMARPVSYTAEARVAVGSTDLGALAIPGYALGSQQLAANIARYVGSNGADGAVRSALGPDAAAVEEVAVSPVVESNIIRVEVSASDAATSRAAADAVAQYLISQSNVVNGGTDVDAILASFSELSRQVATQQQARDTASAALGLLELADPRRPAAIQAVVDATATYDTLLAQKDAAGAEYQDAVSTSGTTYELVVVSPATDSFNNRSSTVQVFVLAGIVLGVVVALLVAVVMERRATSARGSGDPDGPRDERRKKGWTSPGAQTAERGLVGPASRA